MLSLFFMILFVFFGGRGLSSYIFFVACFSFLWWNYYDIISYFCYAADSFDVSVYSDNFALTYDTDFYDFTGVYVLTNFTAFYVILWGRFLHD